MFCRFLGMNNIGGSILKVNVAVAILVYIWIHNVAFSFPSFMYANVHTLIRDGSTVHKCFPIMNGVYLLISHMFNFFVPLIIAWTSNIGIIYKLRHTMNKAVLLH